MKFTATEIGFQDGMGGASNSESRAEYHYVLFGLQVDDQHPKNSGVYFEYDDQLNGSVDSVIGIQIADKAVHFSMTNGELITVVCDKTLLGGPWTAGGPATVRGLVPNMLPYLGNGGQFASNHRAGKNVLFADASVRELTASVSLQVVEALATLTGDKDAVPLND